jgi:DNA-binding CsgD family transcriptional regulator
VERDLVATFLAAAASDTAVLSLEGEPGIGKTTLCRFATELAWAAGSIVLACRPSEAEASLSFAALTDLLAGVTDEQLGALPEPQRLGLAAAALRDSPSGVAPDERSIGTGLATLLTMLSAGGPVVLVVDDAQWLDAPTREVLTFALRRTAASPIGVLVSRRAGAPDGSALAEALPAPSWHERLTVTGLTAAALFHIVRDQLDLTLARPTLVRLTEAARGNPYVALELARTMATAGAATGTVPLPASLLSLTVDRLSSLSPGARGALLAVACSARPTLALLEALGLREQLEEAEALGAVVVVGARVELAHPLLGSAALELADAPSRRKMHGRIARVVIDPEERARHAALSTPTPDEDVASDLDDAVAAAMARGATLSAVELARLAVERTEAPEGAQWWRRRVRLAELLHAAGDTSGAALTLEQLARSCPSGPLKARGWLVLTEVAYQTSSANLAVEHASQAIAESTGDARLHAQALLSLAAVGDPERKGELAYEARRAIEEAGIDADDLLAWAISEQVAARFHAGHGLDRAALDEALERERSGRSWRSSDQVACIRPVLLKWADLPEEALAGLHELRERADAEGNEGIVPYILGHAAGALLRLGRYGEAVEMAREHVAHAETTGQGSQRAQALYNLAIVDAHAGRLVAAETGAVEILAWATAEDDAWVEMSAASVLGFVALSRNDAAVARQHFDRWASLSEQLRLLDPGVSRHHGDHIESLLLTGSTAEAETRTALLEGRSRQAGRVSMAAVAARCRGLISVGGGDNHGAVVHLDRALGLHDESIGPFERARTLLVKGSVHRRMKEKRIAGVALAEAVDAFEELGALAWLARAQAEVRRIGQRPSASLELTETERRVAALAASGLTNRQVAEQAFISPKTVEANLAKVYRKLGISSRAELGARMERDS